MNGKTLTSHSVCVHKTVYVYIYIYIYIYKLNLIIHKQETDSHQEPLTLCLHYHNLDLHMLLSPIF